MKKPVVKVSGGEEHGSFKTTVVQRIKETAQAVQRERDAEWQRWFDAGGILEAIKYPELGRPPSQRTHDDNYKIIMRLIRGEKENK